MANMLAAIPPVFMAPVVVEPRLFLAAFEVHPSLGGGVVEVRVGGSVRPHPAMVRIVELAVYGRGS